MDVLVVALWLLGIIISHLLLRRVVEIDNMNKQLLSEKPKTKVEIIETTEEDLEKELRDYVEAKNYEIPMGTRVQPPLMEQPLSMTQIGVPVPKNMTNVVQEFAEEREMNSGAFGNLEAYEDSGFAPL